MKLRLMSSLLICLSISLDATRIRVRSCTAIPGSASGPSAQGGDAFCGSQRQPSTTSMRSKSLRPSQAKSTETIAVQENKPIINQVGMILSLPTLTQKKILTLTPSEGLFANKLCSLTLELTALKTSDRALLSAEDQNALYRLTIGRTTPQAPATVLTIANIYLPELPERADSLIMLIIQPDGKTYAAQGVISLPTDLPDSAFKNF